MMEGPKRFFSFRNVVLLIVVAAVLLATIPYIHRFGGQWSTSGDPANWGVLGDYFGGILNPVIAGLNLYLVWYLTKYVSEQDKKSKLNEFRYEAYLEFCDVLNYFDVRAADFEGIRSFLDELYMVSFKNRFLFEGIYLAKFDELKKSIDKSAYRAANYLSAIDNFKITHTSPEAPIAEFISENRRSYERDILKFQFLKNALLTLIQSAIVGGKVSDLEKDIEDFLNAFGSKRKESD